MSSERRKSLPRVVLPEEPKAVTSSTGEGWQTVFSGMRSAEESRQAALRREAEEKQRKEYNKVESKRFAVECANTEFLPLFAGLQANIPEIRRAEQSKTVWTVHPDTGEVFLCLLWGRIGLTSAEQKRLQDFLGELVQHEVHSQRIKQSFNEAYKLWTEFRHKSFQLFRKNVPKPQDISIDDVKYRPEGHLKFLECNYLSIGIVPNPQFPRNPKILLPQEVVDFDFYQFDRKLYLEKIGDYLRNPRAIKAEFDPNSGAGNRVEAEECLERAISIPGILVYDLIKYGNPSWLSHGLKYYHCYDSSCHCYTSDCHYPCM